ncbi:hypothetical protein M6D93_01115 [Jatrophihabitans telluris]|uniref:PilZ domain-containing protein n=1 Tax=Jatrophihabitans telluris TaxID=2038343 RepID=A0ABY4QY57_9ACTN|nr:hypothetical protein [Jatrophihabitans telluris]UQX88616.1 hypothetical protein M6D93_01115 [Jatrophihabitans telluris]
MSTRIRPRSDHEGERIEAIFYVAEASAPQRAGDESLMLHGVLFVPGTKAASATHRCVPPAGQRIEPGQRLPVLVDPADPHELTVCWEFAA